VNCTLFSLSPGEEIAFRLNWAKSASFFYLQAVLTGEMTAQKKTMEKRKNIRSMNHALESSLSETNISFGTIRA